MTKRCLISLFITLILAQIAVAQDSFKLLNASFDPTRELYEEINNLFIAKWKSEKNQTLKVRQSHGGSGKQARAIIDGLEADVATLALSFDIDKIAEKGLLDAGWQKRLPFNSAPYTSTIVFVVRKGNPKGIKDWEDLAKPGISVVTPNPKTSGGARWNYLAAWGFAEKKFGGDEKQIQDYMKALFKNVPVLDSGARGSTTTFVQRKIGDVLIAWENEAILSKEMFPADELEIILPSISILAETPVAWIDSVVNKRGAKEIAKAYLEFLFSDEGQKIAAKHHYRPRKPVEGIKAFPEIPLLTIDEHFGGWGEAQKKHFSDGGTFDVIYVPGG